MTAAGVKENLVQKIMLFYKFLLKSLYVRGEVTDMLTGSVVVEYFTTYTDTEVIGCTP